MPKMIREWRGGFVSVDYSSGSEDEEAFVTGVAQWLDLNHPHIVKLFGACHVGKRFYIHEAGEPIENTSFERAHIWRLAYHCGMGLRYLLERGMAYRAFSPEIIMKAENADKYILLHGAGMALSRSADTRSAAPTASGFCYLAEAIWPFLQTDGVEFEIIRATVDQARPASLLEPEWSALKAMAQADAKDKAAVLLIIQQLQALAGPSVDVNQSLINQDEQLCGAVVPTTGVSFELAFLKLREVCTSGTDGQRDLDLQMFERLAVVYDQLQGQICSSLPPELLSSFTSVVGRFYRGTVLRREQSASCMFSDTCAVRTVAGRNYSYHHDIDRLLTFLNVDADDPVHDWKHRWNDTQRQLAQGSPLTLGGGATGCSGTGVTVITEANSEDEHEPREGKGSKSAESDAHDGVLEEKAVLIQFEATKRRGAYSMDALQPLESAQMRLANRVHSVVVPEWFIPSYEVELGEFIAEGSFGAVYRGKWFDTDVVVKILLNDTAEQRRDFVREAEIWFALNHPNVVQLYGASCRTSAVLRV